MKTPTTGVKVLLMRVRMLLRRPKREGITISAIARGVGVDPVTLRRWLSAEHCPSEEGIRALRKWLDKHAPLDTAGQGRPLSRALLKNLVEANLRSTLTEHYGIQMDQYRARLNWVTLPEDWNRLILIDINCMFTHRKTGAQIIAINVVLNKMTGEILEACQYRLD